MRATIRKKTPPAPSAVDVLMNELTEAELEYVKGGIPAEAGEGQEDDPRMLDPSWEAGPTALLRALAWKQRLRTR